MGRVGALRSLSGGSRDGGTEKGGDGEELHRDGLYRGLRFGVVGEVC